MPECFNPRLIKLHKPIARTGEVLSYVNVMCGKCANCIKRRRMEWCFRMEQEMRDSKTCYFVTLTYDSKHVPWDTWGNMVLVKTTLDSKILHRKVKGLKAVKEKYLRKMKMKESGWYDNSAQGFIKRLRTKHERNKIITRDMWLHNLLPSDKMKYFLCGEYGERFGRPHFHAIIFNGDEKMIRDSWTFGDVQIVKATSETIAYVTKYMDKWKDKKQDWRKPIEFNTQSEAIGISFVKRMMNWYKANLHINFAVNSKGIKIPMPRYFRLKMFTEEEYSSQIGIISDELKRLKDYEIDLIGQEKYDKRKWFMKKYTEIKFKKDTKKRDM